MLVGESVETHAYESWVVRSIAELGLEHRVIRLGFHPDVLSIQAAVDIAVLVSEREALGTSILEAMALGVPVIVSTDGGLPELVKSRPGAGMVVSLNADELADALGTLIRSRELRDSMGLIGRAVCEEHCSLHQQGSRMADFFTSILQRAC